MDLTEAACLLGLDDPGNLPRADRLHTAAVVRAQADGDRVQEQMLNEALAVIQDAYWRRYKFRSASQGRSDTVVHGVAPRSRDGGCVDARGATPEKTVPDTASQSVQAHLNKGGSGSLTEVATNVLDEHSTHWGSWEDLPHARGYGSRVESAARSWAEARTPDPLAESYEQEVAEWQLTLKAHERSRSIGVGVLFVGVPVIGWALSPLEGPAIAVLVLLGVALLVWIRQGPPPRPQTPRQPAREASVAALAQRIIDEARRIDIARRGRTDLVSLKESTGGRWQPLGPRPRALREVTWRDAEHLAAEWLRWLGVAQVTVTARTRDGGVDVVGDGAIAQVKWSAAKIPPAFVHQIFGVASTRRVRAVFFSASDYSNAAQAAADDAGVLLFMMVADPPALVPRSSSARDALDVGIGGLR